MDSSRIYLLHMSCQETFKTIIIQLFCSCPMYRWIALLTLASIALGSFLRRHVRKRHFLHVYVFFVRSEKESQSR